MKKITHRFFSMATKQFGPPSVSQYAAALMNLRAILHLNGKLQEAEANYLRALQLKPDDLITQSNLRKLWNVMHKQGVKASGS